MKHTIAVTIVLLSLGGYMHLPIEAVKTPEDFAHFPLVIGEWQGHQELTALAELSELGADGIVSMQYLSGSGEEVDLQVGYFEFQRQGKELAGDRVERFLLGDNAPDQEYVGLDGLQVRRIARRQGNGYRMVLCWYEVDGRSFGSPWRVMLQSMQDGLLHRRTNGAVVMIAADYAAPERFSQTRQQLEAFAKSVIPAVKTALAPTVRIEETHRYLVPAS